MEKEAESYQTRIRPFAKPRPQADRPGPALLFSERGISWPRPFRPVFVPPPALPSGSLISRARCLSGVYLNLGETVAHAGVLLGFRRARSRGPSCGEAARRRLRLGDPGRGAPSG
jgi:hypothetical protein